MSTHLKIMDGPSREELFDSLRRRDLEVKVSFEIFGRYFSAPRGAPGCGVYGEIFTGIVTEIRADLVDNNAWLVRIVGNGIDKRKGKEEFYVEYNSKTRKGKSI